MKKSAMEMLDIGLLIIVLGLAISLGINNLYKTYRQVQSDSLSYMEDKNTGKSKGYLINEYGTYDGTLSKMQVVLMSQIQDSNMPSPRKVVVNGKDVDIPFNYKEYRFECGQNIWLLVKNQDNTTRYSIDYKYSVDSNGTVKDEFYAVNAVK